MSNYEVMNVCLRYILTIHDKIITKKREQFRLQQD